MMGKDVFEKSEAVIAEQYQRWKPPVWARIAFALAAVMVGLTVFGLAFTIGEWWAEGDTITHTNESCEGYAYLVEPGADEVTREVDCRETSWTETHGVYEEWPMMIKAPAWVLFLVSVAVLGFTGLVLLMCGPVFAFHPDGTAWARAVKIRRAVKRANECL